MRPDRGRVDLMLMTGMVVMQTHDTGFLVVELDGQGGIEHVDALTVIDRDGLVSVDPAERRFLLADTGDDAVFFDARRWTRIGFTEGRGSASDWPQFPRNLADAGRG